MTRPAQEVFDADLVDRTHRRIDGAVLTFLMRIKFAHGSDLSYDLRGELAFAPARIACT